MPCLHRRLFNAAFLAYVNTREGDYAESDLWQLCGIGAPSAEREVSFTGPIKLIQGTRLDRPTIDQVLVGPVAEGVLVAFRGTQPPSLHPLQHALSVFFDWLNDGDAFPHGLSSSGRVHQGFWESLECLFPKVKAAVDALGGAGPDRRLLITGHSKGGPLANLAGWRFATEHTGWAPDKIEIVTFAAARAGDETFASAFKAFGLQTTGYEIQADVVPDLPPDFDVSGPARALAMMLPPSFARAFQPQGYVPLENRIRDTEPPFVAFEENVRHMFDWLGDRLSGMTAEQWAPLAVEAHSILPGSAYDRLVCAHNPPDCNHV